MQDIRVINALCALLGCSNDQITDHGPSLFIVGGKPFYVMGPNSPAGMPTGNISLVGERDGYKVYAHV